MRRPTLPRAATARLPLTGLALALCAVALASAPAGSASAAAAPAPQATLTSAQQHYLALAQSGVASAKRRWRDPRLGWDDER